MYFLILLLLALLTMAIIVLLHREQRRKRAEIAELTAPLAAVDLAFGEPPVTATPSSVHAPLPDVPVFTAAVPVPDAAAGDHWQEQVRQLRESGQEAAALQLCRQQFPRIQAFQQAAVLLRQQIRVQVENHQDTRRDLRELYRIAVMADLYRNSNATKPRDARHTLQRLQSLEFDYQTIGTRHLRLLTKSDIRHLEQLWGRPAAHRHAEDSPGLDWTRLCE